MERYGTRVARGSSNFDLYFLFSRRTHRRTCTSTRRAVIRSTRVRASYGFVVIVRARAWSEIVFITRVTYVRRQGRGVTLLLLLLRLLLHRYLSPTIIIWGFGDVRSFEKTRLASRVFFSFSVRGGVTNSSPPPSTHRAGTFRRYFDTILRPRDLYREEWRASFFSFIMPLHPSPPTNINGFRREFRAKKIRRRIFPVRNVNEILPDGITVVSYVRVPYGRLKKQPPT